MMPRSTSLYLAISVLALLACSREKNPSSPEAPPVFDLKVEAISINPPEPVYGQDIRILVTVRNVGRKTAVAGNTWIRLDGQALPSPFPLHRLEPGEADIAGRTIDPPAEGAHSFEVCTYDLFRSPEDDTTNNCQGLELNIKLGSPRIPMPPIPDSLDFYSSIPGAQSARQQANRVIREAQERIRKNFQCLLPLDTPLWQSSGDTCWTRSYVSGSCPYTATVLRGPDGFRWTISRSAACGADDPEANVVVTAASDLDGKTGVVTRWIPSENTTERLTWSDKVYYRGRTWTLWKGESAPPEFVGTLIFLSAPRGGWSLDWSPGSGTAWGLTTGPDAVSGSLWYAQVHSGFSGSDLIRWSPAGGSWVHTSPDNEEFARETW